MSLLRWIILPVLFTVACSTGNGRKPVADVSDVGGEFADGRVEFSAPDGTLAELPGAEVPAGDVEPKTADQIGPELVPGDLFAELPVPDVPIEAVGPEEQNELAPDSCGDGECLGDENFFSCPEDCPSVCGDGICDLETEDCQSCFEDCGACPVGWCTLSGKAGDEVSCPVNLVAVSAAAPRATGLQLRFMFDESLAHFSYFHDLDCADPENCADWNIPPETSIKPTGHTLKWEKMAPGLIRVIIFHFSQWDLPLSEAYLEGDQVVGDPWLFDIVFTLQVDVSPNTPVIVSLDELTSTDEEANTYDVVVQGNLLVTPE